MAEESPHPQRVDVVMDAHVCSCTYVCVCIWVWVYIYVHFFVVSVACTLEQVFWTLVHGQVCALHRCVFMPTYTSANTLAAGCAHMCIFMHLCICMHMHMHLYTHTCTHIYTRLHMHTYAQIGNLSNNASTCQAIS